MFSNDILEENGLIGVSSFEIKVSKKFFRSHLLFLKKRWTTHVNNMMIFNITKDLGLHENQQCLQYPKQQHSYYLDSNSWSVKSLLTNTFFGLKVVAGSGNCEFLCLMIAINSDENLSR